MSPVSSDYKPNNLFLHYQPKSDYSTNFLFLPYQFYLWDFVSGSIFRSPPLKLNHCVVCKREGGGRVIATEGFGRCSSVTLGHVSCAHGVLYVSAWSLKRSNFFGAFRSGVPRLLTDLRRYFLRVRCAILPLPPSVIVILERGIYGS